MSEVSMTVERRAGAIIFFMNISPCLQVFLMHTPIIINYMIIAIKIFIKTFKKCK
ncbi:hypothetical protein GCM10007190_18660 [Macrococcus hajekii]|nr:hypothetical protein GCM10007190_18660 [Macrococcus hajekii]